MNKLKINDVINKLKSSEYHAVEQDLLAFLYHSDTGGDIHISNFTSLEIENNKQHQQEFLYINQWTDVIIDLFNTDDYTSSSNFLEGLVYFKRVWEWLFSASKWDNTDQLISSLNLVPTHQNGKLLLSEPKITLLMSLICLNSQYKLPWKELLTVSPRIVSSTYIGLIDQVIPTISKKSSDGFDYLLGVSTDFPMLNYQQTNDISKFLGSAFHSSYSNVHDKYAFKNWLVKLIRYNCNHSWLSQEAKEKMMAIPANKPINKNTKLNMLVMVEKLTSSHAMYRCYKNIFEALSQDFTLTVLSQENDLDHQSKQLFDKHIFISNIYDINANSLTAINQQADVIFYPSIGMNLWTLCLSQLRLAPKQIMMGGHPSSSLSNQIDSILIPTSIYSAESLQPFFSEQVLMSKTNAKHIFNHQIHPSLTDEFIKEHGVYKANSSSCHKFTIGINGVLTKINTSLISLCCEIEKRAKTTITFIFFTDFNPEKLVYLSAYNQIANQLKNFELVQYKNYLSHLSVISHCDFLLPTLPFGGSNSNIDAMLLNKVKLYIRGEKELYTRTDQIEWERMGLDSELGCDNEEELITKAVKLIRDSDYRYYLYNKIKTHCPKNKVFEDQMFEPSKVSELFFQAIK